MNALYELLISLYLLYCQADFFRVGVCANLQYSERHNANIISASGKGIYILTMDKAQALKKGLRIQLDYSYNKYGEKIQKIRWKPNDTNRHAIANRAQFLMTLEQFEKECEFDRIRFNWEEKNQGKTFERLVAEHDGVKNWEFHIIPWYEEPDYITPATGKRIQAKFEFCTLAKETDIAEIEKRFPDVTIG